MPSLDSDPGSSSRIGAVDEKLIPTGQFANLTWLSPNALRLHQSQGVLVPVEVDERSGYRPSPVETTDEEVR